jgi:hypothetical protein
MMNSVFFKKKSGTYQQFQLKKIKLWISKTPNPISWGFTATKSARTCQDTLTTTKQQIEAHNYKCRLVRLFRT